MKRRNNLTRKQKAIWSVLAVLVMVLTANLVFQTGYFLPVQPLREWEEYFGDEDLTIVEQQWEPKIDASFGTGVVYLAANDYALLMENERFSLLRGWVRDRRGIQYRIAEDAITVGALHLPCNSSGSIDYIFGVISHPDVETIVVKSFNEQNGQVKEFCTLYRKNFVEQDGEVYFLCRRDNWQYHPSDQLQAFGYDAGGILVAQGFV